MSNFIADNFAQPDPNAKPSRLIRSTDPTLALRQAFPGIWIREDGAFRDDDNGIAWSPGDVEKQDDHLSGMLPSGGLCYFGGPPAMGRGPRLKLSQMWALCDYIAWMTEGK